MRNLIPSSFDATLMLRIWAWLFAFSGFIVYFFHGVSLYLFLAALGSLFAATIMPGAIHLVSGEMHLIILTLACSGDHSRSPDD